MPKRDRDVSHRWRWACALSLVLVVGAGSSAAQAYWQRSQPLPAVTVTSGDLNVVATWAGTMPAPGPLYPGQNRDLANLIVTETSASGSTLRWRLRPAVLLPISAPGSTYVQTTVYVQSCGTGVVIAPGTSYAPPGGLLPGESVELCVRISLRADAPGDFTKVVLDPTVEVRAVQALS